MKEMDGAISDLRRAISELGEKNRFEGDSLAGQWVNLLRQIQAALQRLDERVAVLESRTGSQSGI